MNLIKFFIKLILILLIAAIPSIWIAQNDPRVQQFATQKLIEFLSNEWKATVTVESSDINLFTGCIVLKNGMVKSKDVSKDFSWKFEIAKIYFSRLGYFFNNEIPLDINLYNVKAKASFGASQLSIADHLNDIFSTTPDIPIKLASVIINNLKFFVNINHDGFKNIKTFFLTLDGELHAKQQEADNWQAFLSLQDGKVLFNEKTFLEKINWNGGFCFGKYDQDSFFNVNNHFSCLDKSCFLEIAWNQSNKKIELKSNDGLVDLTASVGSDQEINIIGTTTIEFIKNIYDFIYEGVIDNYITGTCKFDIVLNTTRDSQSIGKIKIENAKIADLSFKECDINFRQEKNKICADFSSVQALAFSKNDIKIAGRAFWNFGKNHGGLSLSNSDQINIGNQNSYHIKPQNFVANARIRQDLSCLGKYKVAIFSQDSAPYYLFGGNYFFKDGQLKTSGKTLRSDYYIEANLQHKFSFKKILSINKGKKVIDLHQNKDGSLVGRVKYSYLKSFLPTEIKRKIFGKSATVYLKVNQEDWNNLTGGVKLLGKLSFWGVYNPIEKIRFDFSANFLKKKLLLNNFLLEFLKGKVSCHRVTLNFDDDYQINFTHAPIQIDDLLINWKNDFYGLLYGNLLISKKDVPDYPDGSVFKVFGDLVLKKSLFKENVFLKENESDYLGEVSHTDHLSGIDQIIDLDINLLSESPIRIKTSFLQAESDLDLNLRALYFNNKLQAPQLTGSIDLEKGTLNFLHHKLFINYGKVQFIPSQPNDTIIDLVAKNKIRKYLITLQATGSVQNPNILLESSPELSEEQILALLIAGSENASFQTDLPTILMQNLNSLVIGSKDVHPKTTSFFQKLTLPFKYVQITPNFTSQTGRGGIKGTVAIDLNKQMHAQIQKNFNLQEDLAFQVEYFLTDDINLKVIRDQRGEVGSEVEVRLKL